MTVPARSSTPDAVPLDAERFHTDPVSLYRELRHRHGSVVPVLLPGDIPAWLVIGYREVHRVTSDPETYTRDATHWNQWASVPVDWPLLPLVGRPGTATARAVGGGRAHRAAVLGEALDAMEPGEPRRHAERIADTLIDAFCRDGRAELVAEYAARLPILVLAELCGLAEDETPDLVRALRSGADRDRVTALMRRLLARRRAAPGADVASRLLAAASGASGASGADEAEPAGTEPAETELAEDLAALCAAGYLPTADWLGGTLRLMLTDPRYAEPEAGGRLGVDRAMNEVLWRDTPTQNVIGRWATRDAQLGPRRLRAGDLLVLGLQGANGDPLVHGTSAPAASAAAFYGLAGLVSEPEPVPEPALGGPANSAYLSFGHGERRCPFPAQEIAETITRTGVEVLLDRLPDVEPAIATTELTHHPSPWQRGPTALPVRFTPMPASR
ncbi:cytochrome P450 [Streptomyces hainanensis]|uniref:Cytochrome P450 n=1 Tax=Streptomyces hainanensis TaxID=402648 RepID=A0A4R4TMA7_9ACTN|nr:cytochrome P450 [Streptomyces hainanensis]TDC75199.1 cytochrome P450 [Streptomyces hainanensis]